MAPVRRLRRVVALRTQRRWRARLLRAGATGRPVFDQDGVLRKKAYLLTQIDVASRFLHEAAEHHQ